MSYKTDIRTDDSNGCFGYSKTLNSSDAGPGGGGAGDVHLPHHYPQLYQQGAPQALQHSPGATVHSKETTGTLVSFVLYASLYQPLPFLTISVTTVYGPPCL